MTQGLVYINGQAAPQGTAFGFNGGQTAFTPAEWTALKGYDGSPQSIQSLMNAGILPPNFNQLPKFEQQSLTGLISQQSALASTGAQQAATTQSANQAAASAAAQQAQKNVQATTPSYAGSFRSQNNAINQGFVPTVFQPTPPQNAQPGASVLAAAPPQIQAIQAQKLASIANAQPVAVGTTQPVIPSVSGAGTPLGGGGIPASTLPASDKRLKRMSALEAKFGGGR